MKHFWEKYAIVCGLALFASACATTTAFRYDHPPSIKPIVSDLKIAVAYPKDERQPDKEVDKIWEKSPIDAIDKIIMAEIRSTGLFGEIASIKNESETNASRIILLPTLKELVWEIPNYDEVWRNSAIFSFFTGGIGGLIYGTSGNMDFYGKAKLRMLLVDREAKLNILDKEYYCRAEKKVARLYLDSSEERAIIIGTALKQVMDQFKEDLRQLVKDGKLNNSYSQPPNHRLKLTARLLLAERPQLSRSVRHAL